jgi:schlafen family protein
MPNTWNEAEIQRYIDDQEEESLTLDYKAASAFAKSDGKKTEITIAVSAMANSAGGIIIYGLREHPTARHRADKLDPIDRTQFSKEWLEHVINNIRPRLSSVIIHPVSLASGSNDVAYVVEIPQSNTAHQANDKRYYKRFNFECVPMEDFEIRDIMNRATIPDVEVEFKYMKLGGSAENRLYRIHPVLTNLGTQVVNNFKLEFTVPRPVGVEGQQLAHPLENVRITLDSKNDYVISYQSKRVLFPHEVRNLGEEILFPYRMNREIYDELKTLELNGHNPTVDWTLYADNMPPKTGSVLFRTLHDY